MKLCVCPVGAKPARALSGGLIGSPETIRARRRKFQTSHVDQIILLNQAGKNTHEHICESLELFAKEVMPEFQASVQLGKSKPAATVGD